MANLFFTADLHLGHTNIIKYCNRPFTSVEEMDETLISNWNKVVRPQDTVYFLGDFVFGRGAKPAKEYFDRLNGKKCLIVGNHDDPRSIFKLGWYIIEGNITELKSWGSRAFKPPITLCHYAMRVWNHSHHGAWHLYGHSHGSLPDDTHALSWEVGVDNNNFTPVSLEELETIMSKKTPNIVGGIHVPVL